MRGSTNSADSDHWAFHSGSEQRLRAYLVEEIETSGLFDSEFYLSEAPAAKEYQGGIIAHFMDVGWRLGLNPHILFDSAYYLLGCSDLLESELNSLTHFIQFGASEKRNPHPLFDSAYYLSCNREVARSGINPLIHYIRIGAESGTNPHILFDTSYYRQQMESAGMKMENALTHFLAQSGEIELNPHPLFDVCFYRSCYRLKPGENPLLHYLAYGANHGYKPHPLFDGVYYAAQFDQGLPPGTNPLIHFLSQPEPLASPHPLFDARFYCKLYPDVKDAGVNPLIHYIRYGAGELKDPSPLFETHYYLERHPEVRQAGVNPLVHYVSCGEKLGYSPSPMKLSQEPMSALTSYDRLLAQVAVGCKHLFVLGCLMRGGAERSAAHCIHAVAARADTIDDIIVLVTDCPDITCPEWLPEGTKIVNLAESQSKISLYDKGAFLLKLMQASQAHTVHIFNSPRAYAALGYYLEHYPRPQAKIISYLCGYELYTEQNFSGFNDGPLAESLSRLDLILADNHRLSLALSEKHQHLPDIAAKARTCYQPLAPSLIESLRKTLPAAGGKMNAGKILWASRLDDTKRPDLLFLIAQRMPHVHFAVYGYSSGGYDYSFLRSLSNVELMGQFADFASIPKQDIAAFLYTSNADGMPNVLLEAIGSRLPVVAPDVGGISELITEKTGWLIKTADDIEDYVHSLSEILCHPERAVARVQAAYDLLSLRHSWPSYVSTLQDLDII